MTNEQYEPERNGTLEILATALPEQFEFYHLGPVHLSPSPKTEDYEWSERHAIGIAFAGDMKALLVLLLEKHLDPSIYSELGNIIASQLSNRLYSEKGLEVLISPPVEISTQRLNQILNKESKMIRKTYVHSYKNLLIPIETLILPDIAEEMGYA